MFQDITVREWAALRQKKELVTIDVRSPSEYEETTIPGSLNIPLFDDKERAEIGTLYKQQSVQAAKEKGLEIVSAKLPSFIKQFAAISGSKAVFCWRGGMRSKTSATVLSLMGIQAYRLTGGYRAYRQWVVDELAAIRFEPQALVLHGHTGSGKTAVLRRMKQQGYPVLDLEAMAGHRGSVFGQIGMKAHNQKTFDSLLVEDLLAYRALPCVLLEAESRRIGKAVLPDLIIDKKKQGHHILLELPLEARVRHILQDYRPWDHPDECMQAFQQIKTRIHTPVAAEIESFLKRENYAGAVELLLLYYYDPRYAHSSSIYDFGSVITVQAQSADEVLEKLRQIVHDAGFHPE
ncbi:tRNA 2-selenouridine(34) synthase MnmH [Paenibacillus tarimensis]